MNQAASHRQGCGKGRALAARPRETAGFASPRPRSGPFWLSQSCWAAGKLLLAWRARRAALRLAEPDVTPQEIEAAAEHGRAAVYELLKIFSSTAKEPERRAAGIALGASGCLTISWPRKSRLSSVADTRSPGVPAAAILVLCVP